jgi:hypothetical protein
MSVAPALASIAAAIVLCATAACSGGRGGGTTPATPPIATSASAIATLSAAGTTIVTLPAVGGYVATLVLGQLATGQSATPVVVAASTSPAGGATALSAQTLAAASTTGTGEAVQPIVYLSITTSTTVQIDGVASLSLALPSGSNATETYSLASYSTGTSFSGSDDQGPWSPIDGPDTATSGFVRFNGTTSSQVIEPGSPVYFAVYTP